MEMKRLDKITLILTLAKEEHSFEFDTKRSGNH
jgi:hypothetical protein